MQALRETTDWGDVSCPNHLYLLDGNCLVAYIRQGTSEPFYFKEPIKGFDQRGRKFVPVEPNPFDAPAASELAAESNVKLVQGSKGQTYRVDVVAGSCTCPGFTFRGTCKHLKELACVA